MSKKVDERVVEMRFDNQQFESATKQTMSTLDKLKAALKLPTSSKALDGVSSAAKNSTSNLAGLGSAVETVNARFSALQVVGMTALSNITSAAMQAGTNIVKSFTIDPVISGFQEYETQLNAVQTILANTSSKGTTMDQVTAALDELNTYADKTIYNFTEMTRNIGTFTAAGVDLDTSVSAIQGIANLAAVSGSNSAQASQAMYQLSQALAAGRVSLMDWNSVVNAGMGGEVFQEALKRTARVMGTGVDEAIEKYGSFKDSLTQGQWLTTDVLTETLKQFTMAAEEGSAQWDEFKKSLMDQGYTEAQATEILKMANTATDAATKVKTFTQMMDTLKEAMGSGWAKTWQLIFGDFEEAREFWTDMSNGLGDMINNFSDARNEVIAGAMGMGGESRWGEFTAQLDKAGVSIDAFQSKLAEVASAKGVDLGALITEYGSLEKAMASGQITADMVTEALDKLAVSTDKVGDSTKSLAEWQGVVDEVWKGTYGNIDTGRMEKLAAAGWEYAEVQKLVNATVDGHRLTLEDLNAAQLESMGYTKEQAQAMADFAAEAKKSGGEVSTLINDILTPKKSGRELFLEGLKNTIYAILRPLQALAGAFSDVFGMDAAGLYNLIEGFNKFSQMILISDADMANLQSTFRGLFSLIHLVATVAGNGLVFAFNAANAILAPFGTNLLGVTGFIGDLIYGFEQWLTSGTAITDMLNTLGSMFSWIIEPVKQFWDSMFPEDAMIDNPFTRLVAAFEEVKHYFSSFEGLNPGEIFSKFSGDISNFFGGFSWEGVLAGLKSFGGMVADTIENIAQSVAMLAPDILAGLQNGLMNGAGSVITFLSDIATKLIEAVKAVLGIHSPSTVFFDIGKNIVEGLVNGIKYLSGKVAETLTAIFEDIQSVLGTIDWGTILTVGAGVGTFTVFYKLTDALQTFANAAENLTSPFEFLENLSGSLDKLAKAKSFEMKADAIKNIAISIAILAGSLVVLSQVDPAKLWSSVGALIVMGGVLAGIVAVTGLFGKNKKSSGGVKEAVTQILDLAKLAGLMVSIGASMLMLAGAMAIIGGMDQGQVKQAGIVLAAFAGVVAVLIGITKICKDSDLNGAASFASKIGVAFILLAASARLMGGMTPEGMGAAQDMLATFTILVMGLIAITKIAGKNVDKAASFLSKIGTAFLLLGVTARLLGGMDAGEMDAARTMLSSFTILMMGLIAITKVAGKQVDQLSGFLLKVSAAFVLLGVAAKILGGLTPGEMIQAGIAIGAFVGVMAALVAITNLAPKDKIAQISTTLLAMSASIAILAAVAALLGMVDPGQLAQGIIAVGFLAAIVAALVAVTKNAKDVKGTMIGIAAAIGVMAASVAVLSLLDPARVALATACMTVLMGMFALVVKMGSNVQTSMGVMIAMVAAIAVLGAVVAVLANMPVEGVIASAASLSAMLLSLAASMKIISTIGSISTNALVSVGILTAVMAALGLILAMMTALNVQSAIPNAIALSTMLLAMSAAMKILDTVGSVSMGVMGAMGILTAIMAGLGLVLAMMSALGVQSAIPNAIALSTLALAMSGVMVILSAIGPMASAAIPAAGAMAAVIGILAGVVAAAGAIAQIPGAEWLVSEGAAFLQSLGEAIGGFVGGIVGGALEAATSTLPQVAMNLSLFGVGLQPFIMSMKQIDPSITDACTNLAGAILALTGAGVIDAIASFFGAGSMIGSIGEQLVPFGQAMADFAATLDGVNLGALLIGSQAAKYIADMANAMPKEGGILDSIFGSTVDLGTFGENLKTFGTGMKSYAESIAGVDVASIQNSIPAAEGLAELANKLPAEGGLMQSIFGTSTDLSSFGQQLVDFGDGLQQYAGKVTGLDTGSIENSIPAARSLNELAGELPASGGLMQSIFGGNSDLSNFGGQLSSFGDGLQQYSSKVTGLNTEGIASSITSVRDILNILQAYTNASDLDTGIANAKKISGVGEAIKTYNDKVAGVDTGQISNSITAVNGLKDAINGLVGIDSSGIASFQSAIDQLASTNVQGLISAFQNVDLSGVGANILTTLASGLQSGSSQVMSALNSIAKSMTSYLNAQAIAFIPLGVLLMTNLNKGITAGGKTMPSTIRSVLASAVNAINSYYGSFYSAGSYISSGLANGMSSRLGQIRSVAAQMASAAAQATRAAAAVRSPSRVFMEIGDYMGQGLVIGMENEASSIYKAGTKMGDSAFDGINKTVSRLSDVLNSDMDVTPTIRPVLDLEDVKNGASSINSMLSGTVPMNVLGRVNSISRSMDARIQNGSFNDVVGAIEKLRTGLSELGGTTYNVNGVTYDDGTNVANAVGDLTRAIRLQRRV